MNIQVVADIVCPWCFIGHRRLAQALADEGVADDAKVVHRPFLLEPGMPREGADLRERLAAKYRRDPEGMFRVVEENARTSGIALDFAKVRRFPSTLPAHTLLRHAEKRDTQKALLDALYAAYFLDGKDIGDAAVLDELARAHGFDDGEVVRLLGDEAEASRTRAEADAAVEAGIGGVPFFILNDRVAVEGAQPVEVFRGALRELESLR